MLPYLPLRKLFKCIQRKRNISKKEMAPSCLTECLLKETNNHDVKSNRFLTIIVLLVFIILYFMESRLHYQNYVIQETVINIKNETSQIVDLPVCHINKTNLGKVSIAKLVMDKVLEQVYPNVQKGGYYVPKDCKSRNKVGILVPYRDRAMHLPIFLYNIHPFLMKQKLEYRIFVIEQAGADLFNRGRLLNAGFLEMMKLGDWRCVIFHDVDLLPLDEEIMYTCPIWPRNMCADIVDEKNPKIRTLFGGVSAMNVVHFNKVNGYSNYYWGWGGEDNDLFRRLQDSGFPVVKYDRKIARYTSLPHLGRQPNNNRYKLLKNAVVRYRKEGLTTLKYKVLSSSLHHLYTHILIDINFEKCKRNCF